MSTLAQQIALDIYPEERLRAVPAAVVDDVTRLVLEALAVRIPEAHLARIADASCAWRMCEACKVIVPDDAPGLVHDVEEGIVLCEQCAKVAREEERRRREAREP